MPKIDVGNDEGEYDDGKDGLEGDFEDGIKNE